jgi:hypothetical protein
MADRSNFTSDEWKLLLESVTMAGIAVSAADPSGLCGPSERKLRRGRGARCSEIGPHSEASDQGRRGGL